MTLVVDTSVSVPALVAQHAAHESCLGVLRRYRPGIAGHAWIETFAVVTGLPLGRRSARDIASRLADHFDSVHWPTGDEARALPVRCAELGISGGGAYDALVALAVPAGARLVTRDRRAAGTYRAVGVEVVSPDDLT